jgi:TetR/AcrR family transcriptional repressor of bet genes
MPRIEAAERREQIIKATYRAFTSPTKKGMAEVTLQDIADEANFSKGVVMYYFDSKEKVFVALLEWLVYQIADRVERNVSQVTGVEAKLQALIDSVFLSERENRRFYTVYLDFATEGLRNHNFRSINTAFLELFREVGREIIEEGVKQGIFRPVDLDEAAAFIRAVVDGMCLQWLFDDSSSPEETFERYRSYAFSSIRAYLRK